MLGALLIGALFSEALFLGALLLDASVALLLVDGLTELDLSAAEELAFAEPLLSLATGVAGFFSVTISSLLLRAN
ncbi:hypothetical protein OAP17_00650 [Porticoccaceae bacterium]|nr:hypothetical protein [Porticoccaceae bacterium]